MLTALHCTALYCTVLCCTVLYSTEQFYRALYCTAVYCTHLYRTVPYRTMINSNEWTEWFPNGEWKDRRKGSNLSCVCERTLFGSSNCCTVHFKYNYLFVHYSKIHTVSYSLLYITSSRYSTVLLTSNAPCCAVLCLCLCHFTSSFSIEIAFVMIHSADAVQCTAMQSDLQHS